MKKKEFAENHITVDDMVEDIYIFSIVQATFSNKSLDLSPDYFMSLHIYFV